MSEPVHPQSLPRRRVVLVAGWAAASLTTIGGPGLLGGCRSGASSAPLAPPPTPAPDEVLRRRAVTQVRELLAAVNGSGARPTVRPVLGRLAAGYRQQLTALGEAVPTVSGTASAAVTTSPSSAASIVAAQLTAARQALADSATAGAAGMAVLLARLAAAHAAEADLLSAVARLPVPGPVTLATSPQATAAADSTGTTGPAGESGSAGETGTGPTGSGLTTPGAVTSTTAPDFSTGPPPAAISSLAPQQATALTRLLQGEHAAAYAYGTVAAWVAPALRRRARTCWAGHLAGRDALIRLLTTAGVAAPAASPAYDVGAVPTGSSAAVALAAKVEGRCAALAAATVAVTSDGARLLAAEVLVTSARRQAGWTGSVPALPG